jgi:hypothetical protein
MGVALILMLVLQTALRATGGQGALPLDARQRLDTLYPGWRFATVTTALQRSFPAPFSAAWVSGDFDGDGKRDYAVQLGNPALQPIAGNGWSRFSAERRRTMSLPSTPTH